MELDLVDPVAEAVEGLEAGRELVGVAAGQLDVRVAAPSRLTASRSGRSISKRLTFSSGVDWLKTV
jgi:hypothetical protein